MVHPGASWFKVARTPDVVHVCVLGTWRFNSRYSLQWISQGLPNAVSPLRISSLRLIDHLRQERGCLRDSDWIFHGQYFIPFRTIPYPFVLASVCQSRIPWDVLGVSVMWQRVHPHNVLLALTFPGLRQTFWMNSETAIVGNRWSTLRHHDQDSTLETELFSLFIMWQKWVWAPCLQDISVSAIGAAETSGLVQA